MRLILRFIKILIITFIFINTIIIVSKEKIKIRPIEDEKLY